MKCEKACLCLRNGHVLAWGGMLGLEMKYHLQRFFVAALLATLAAPAVGQLSPEESNCFALHTEESQIFASFRINSDWVSEEVASSTVSERLRAAGVFSSGTTYHGGLSAIVSTADDMLIVQLEFFKPVTDPASGESGISMTWTNRGSGRIPERSQAFIAESLTVLTDKFLAEYLQAQEECSKDESG